MQISVCTCYEVLRSVLSGINKWVHRAEHPIIPACTEEMRILRTHLEIPMINCHPCLVLPQNSEYLLNNPMSSKNPFKHSRELGVPRNQALGGSELSIRPAPTFFKRVLCSFVGELRDASGFGGFAASGLLTITVCMCCVEFSSSISARASGKS